MYKSVKRVLNKKIEKIITTQLNNLKLVWTIILSDIKLWKSIEWENRENNDNAIKLWNEIAD